MIAASELRLTKQRNSEHKLQFLEQQNVAGGTLERSLETSHIGVRYCCGFRIWIDDTRLFFQPPTTTRMASSVVVKQLVLFTMFLSYLRIYEEWRRDLPTLSTYNVFIRYNNTRSL